MKYLNRNWNPEIEAVRKQKWNRNWNVFFNSRETKPKLKPDIWVSTHRNWNWHSNAK